MPGRSLTRPPRISTTECSWRLCPSPGMYEVTSMPFVSRTRATLRSAEFGFFGVVVETRVQTPRRCGAASCFLRPCPDLRPGVATFFFGFLRPLRTSWLMLGMRRRMLAAKHGGDPSPCQWGEAWGVGSAWGGGVGGGQWAEKVGAWPTGHAADGLLTASRRSRRTAYPP